MEEGPVHGVKSFSYVHFEQDARDTTCVEQLYRRMDCPKVVVDSSATDESTLVMKH
jgi:hypothetical protein